MDATVGMADAVEKMRVAVEGTRVAAVVAVVAVVAAGAAEVRGRHLWKDTHPWYLNLRQQRMLIEDETWMRKL